MLKLATARRIAIAYAIIIGLISVTMLTGTITSDDVTLKRIVGQSGLAFVASLVPVVIVWIGDKITTTDAGKRIIAASTLAAIASLFVLIALVATSTEPMAPVLLIFTPAIQAAIGVFGLFLAWRR